MLNPLETTKNLNRLLANKNSYIEISRIRSKKHSSGKAGPHWYLYLNQPNGEKRIQVDHKFWESVSNNDPILITLQKGFFGFPIVVNYELP
jgi:hypothetical protein